ncbi:MAG: hypothetical protein C6Y22_09670 [Hapalosiphonaceae cyanobacterium JJU2]|nr:MAG: hypothetical protein C6Y22_09670 [Hapalosiphonaceae cyanobacterium JJU2]
MSRYEKIEIKWQSQAAILTALTLLEVISLPILTNTKTVAQTPSTQSQCTHVKITKHIRQLNKGEPADFNALVACKSKAVPSLIKVLKENQDENLRIIAIALLGEIGSQAAPALPILNGLLKDTNTDVRIIVVHALKKIGKDAVPALTTALKDPDSKVRLAATSALEQINKDKLSIQNNNQCTATNASPQVDVTTRTNNRVISNPTNTSKNCTGNCRTSVQVGVRGVRNHITINPPVMCKIPAIRAVLRWKCP